MKTNKSKYQSPQSEVVVLSPNAEILDSIVIIHHSGGGGFDESEII